MPQSHQPGLFDHLPGALPGGNPKPVKAVVKGTASSPLVPVAASPSVALPLWAPAEESQASEHGLVQALPPSEARPGPVAAESTAPLSPPEFPAPPPVAVEAKQEVVAPQAPVEPKAKPNAQPQAPLPSKASLLNAALDGQGQACLDLALDGRSHQLVVGPQGIRLMRGEELVGEAGWASFASFLGHQRARLATLIGSRRVPPSLLEHPDFRSGILPHLYVNAYHGDRLSRGGMRRRVEVRASDLSTVERLMAVEVACANPECLHAIHPFRPRAKGSPLRLFVGFTCPLEESVACARTRGAKEAMEALVLRVEALGQVAVNDLQR